MCCCDNMVVDMNRSALSTSANCSSQLAFGILPYTLIFPFNDVDFPKLIDQDLVSDEKTPIQVAITTKLTNYIPINLPCFLLTENMFVYNSITL